MIPSPDISKHAALFGLGLDELTGLLAGLGEKPYRARQLFDALYRQRVGAIEEISTLPVGLRERLTATHEVGLPVLSSTARSVDGTERYLVRLNDGETVETVWMPEGDGGERGDGTDAALEEEAEEGSGRRAEDRVDGSSFRRSTICVSSQVGCAVNCQFCLTAKLGIRRNLTAGEIAGQVAAVLNRHQVQLASARGNNNPARINLVFMGQGEPFLNYDSFMAAVRLLVTGMGIPESRMTVSTSGSSRRSGGLPWSRSGPSWRLSLNASNDGVREQIMPITRKWNIAALLDACDTLPLRTREWVTFEYVLLGGVNDQPEHAREVLALLGDGGRR